MPDHWSPRWVWLVVGWLLGLSVFAPWRGNGQTLPRAVYLPLVAVAPAPSPTPTISWDPRLDLRGAYLIPAGTSSDQGAWRLIAARWLDEAESAGRHHIYIDTLDTTGKRQTGVQVRIVWDGGETTVTTEAKPGEPYAANFPMFAVAPAYSAQPASGDLVGGMGLGSIEQPAYKIHTSYELIWQWVSVDDYAR